MPQPIMPQVKTVVFLMLENRSLDNLLGWLYSPERPPLNVYPAGSSPLYDGLVAGKFSNPYQTAFRGVQYYPVVPVPDGLGKDQDRVPAYDPTEEMYSEFTWNGVLNQLFGDYRRIGGVPPYGTPARMQGFYQDYYASYMTGWQGMDILWTYSRSQAPIINSLAFAYGVSDAWFCSAPTQTNPNRAYSLIGTSQGRENNLHLSAVEQYDAPTIFNALGSVGKSWSLYYSDVWKDGKCFTEYTFPQISHAGGPNRIGTLDQFYADAQAGALANFTYIEPKWGYGKGTAFVQGTDYHPPTHISPGEAALLGIFRALYNSPQWDEMLFIVTFDEHGGTYDHVGPQWGAINPDGINGKYFDFRLFGARVPTLLISPFIKPSTVFRAPADSAYPFDHTSFIKTILRWAGVDLGSVNFGKRMPAAPTFDGVLSPERVNGVDVEVALPQSALDIGAPPLPGFEVPPPDGAGQPLNALFEGVPFASVRAIINRSASLTEIHEAMAAYRADPPKFDASL